MLATIYGALGRKTEAAPAIANLLRLYPEMPQKMREEWRKFSVPEEVIDRVLEDLGCAGLNIPPDR